MASFALLVGVIGSYIHHQKVDGRLFLERERLASYSRDLSEARDQLSEARDAENTFLSSTKNLSAARERYQQGSRALDAALERLRVQFEAEEGTELTEFFEDLVFAVRRYQRTVDGLSPIVEDLNSPEEELLLGSIFSTIEDREQTLKDLYGTDEAAGTLLNMQLLSRDFVISLNVQKLDLLREQLDTLPIRSSAQRDTVAQYRTDIDRLLDIALGLELQKASSLLQYQRVLQAIEALEAQLRSRRLARGEALAAEHERHKRLQGVLLLLLAGALLSSLYAQGQARRQLLLRIQQLADAMGAFKTGTPPSFQEPKAASEPLGKLSRQFLEMAEQINEQFSQLLQAQEARIEQESFAAVLEERAKAATQIAESELWFRTLFESAHDMMVIVDELHNVVDINHSGQRLLGRPAEAISGRPMSEVFTTESLGPLQAALVAESREPVEVTLRTDTPPAPRIRVRITEVFIEGRPFLHLIGQDISMLVAANREQQRLEQRLRQAQQFELLGSLAGGIAHDVNNLLTPIVGCAELLESSTMDDPAAEELRQDILLSGKQAAALVRQILRVSRTSAQEKELVNLSEVILLSTRLIQRSLPGNVVLEMAPVDPRLCVMATGGEIQQILSNLCANAVDAMPGGGALRVAIDVVPYGEAPAIVQTEMKRQPVVQIRVSDTGQGMSPEVMARIFEPYFSTKPVQRGTGLGLATVFAIVRRFGGCIVPTSTLGVGTTFDVYLPKAADQVATTVPRDAPTAPPSTVRHVVVVDDEVLNVRLIGRMLRPQGFEVTGFSSSSQALDHLSEHHAQCDLVISDLNMPEPDGIQILERLQELSPALPVIIFTGYGDANSQALATAAGARVVLEKPVLRETMLRTIAELLKA